MGYVTAYGKRLGYTDSDFQQGSKRVRRTARRASGGVRYQYPVSAPGVPGTETKYDESARVARALTAPTDWTGTEIEPDLPGGHTTLFAPAIGTAFNERIARKATVKRIRIKGHIQCPPQVNQTGADAATLIRILLVQDKQTNGAQMQGEDVMAAPLTANANLAVHSFMNLASLGKFDILKDKYIAIQNPSISYDGTNIEQSGLIRQFKIDYYFKKPVVVNFNAGGARTVAAIVDHSWHVIAMTNNTTLAPQITYNSRVYFDG